MPNDDLNPTNMLDHYRLNSTDEQIEQAAMIRQMLPAQAQELLAFMCMHTLMAVQYLHSQIDADEARTQAAPPPPVRN